MLLTKLGLGSAQFGLTYGISNSNQEICTEEVDQILNTALANNIFTIDTSPAYGTAESKIGNFIKKNNEKRFLIVTKLPICRDNEIKSLVQNSISTLQVSSLYGLLNHDYQAEHYNQKTHDQLLELQAQGYVKKIGFSLNFTEELDRILEDDFQFDLVQLPLNLFDRRFETYLPTLKAMGVEVHIRSVFLQGLILMPCDLVPRYLTNVLPFKHKLENYASQLNLTVEAIALGFILFNKYVDRLIFGVDSIGCLNKNLIAIHSLESSADIQKQKFTDLVIDSLDIIVPSNWQNRIC